MSSPTIHEVWRVEYNSAPPGAPFEAWDCDSKWMNEEAAIQALRRSVALGGDAYHGGVVPPHRVLYVLTVSTVVTEHPRVHPDILNF